MSIAGFFSITRPLNAFVAGVAAVVAFLIDTGTIIPEAGLLFLVVALLTAAGNVINDVFDEAIDRINRPDRPIPSKMISGSSALGFSLTLFLSGILVSFFTTPLCIIIAIINSILLVAYAAKLKRTLLLGNLSVAYLTGSIFLFGGALNGWTGLIHILPIATMTFFAMLAREVLKDAEDVEGDSAGGADTIPIRFGVRKTAEISLVIILVAIFVSVVPYVWWGGWYLAGIGLVDAILLTAALRGLPCRTSSCLKGSKASTLLKAGMFASLVVFTVSSVFI